MPHPAVGDTGSEPDTTRHLAESPRERGEIFGVVALTDPRRTQPKRLHGLYLLNAGTGFRYTSSTSTLR